jgi:CO dehydrogenase maturation factor
MPLKIAVAGKGGTGKTTIAALLCRTLMEREHRPLLAVDADPNSCLPERLGVRLDRSIGQLREELRAEPEKVPAGIAKSEWVERLINEEITEATGFDLIAMGRQEGPDCYCYINNMLRTCLQKIEGHYRAVVIDNEAGLEHLSRRTNGQVDVMLVVCHATLLGARTAMRVVELMRSLELEIGEALLVLNLADGRLAPELEAEFAKTGLEILGHVPADPQVAEFEMRQQSLLEMPGDAGAVQAVDGLVETLLERRNAS